MTKKSSRVNYVWVINVSSSQTAFSYLGEYFVEQRTIVKTQTPLAKGLINVGHVFVERVLLSTVGLVELSS